MSQAFHADAVHRTALLALHDDSAPTLEAALEAHASTGVILCAAARTCADIHGQAALLTAAVTAARAFGNVLVVAEGLHEMIEGSALSGETLADAMQREGVIAVGAETLGNTDASWPIIFVGDELPSSMDPSGAICAGRVVLHATWGGWVAAVSPQPHPTPVDRDASCVLAAIAAAALSVCEAFAAVRAEPGSDSGYRRIELNLWAPGQTQDTGPALAYAPSDWWLVGLGHLGQAYSWVISWLGYADPASTEIVLQDTDLTSPANHSTGVLTPRGSVGVPKTRLVAAALGRAGFRTRIIERRIGPGPDIRAAESDTHVALLGVDNLPTRRLISHIGWRLAIDVGLGAGPTDYSALLLRRFPGALSSDATTGWATTGPASIDPPRTRAFDDLAGRDVCGVVELAGKAVGASFVGVVAACVAVAEACRELHGGEGNDVMALDLATLDPLLGPATRVADVTSARLTVNARGR